MSLLPNTTMSAAPVVNVATNQVGDGKFEINISITINVPTTTGGDVVVPETAQEVLPARKPEEDVTDDESSDDDDKMDDEADEDTTAADTERLRTDLKYWEIVDDDLNPGWMLVWPGDIHSVYRGRHKDSDPVIPTGTLYHSPLHFEESTLGRGYWVKRDSELGRLILQNHQHKKELTDREKLEADMKKHWFVKSINPDGDPDHNALIGVTKESAYACRWHVLDTHGLYNRLIYYTSHGDGYWVNKDSDLVKMIRESGNAGREDPITKAEEEKNSTRELKVVVPGEDKPIENVPNIQDDWKNWEIVRWLDKENVIIKPTEKSLFSHCPAVFNGKMGVPVVWAKTGPSPDQKSMLKYDHNCEGYRIHFSSVLMAFLPRYTYEDYYYSQRGRYPTDSIPLLADDVKHWEFVAWKDSNRIIVRPGSMSKYHNCPAIVSLVRHKSIGGSVGYILRYDTTHKGYCVDADDENFASIIRPTYEEFINEADGGETRE